MNSISLIEAFSQIDTLTQKYTDKNRIIKEGLGVYLSLLQSKIAIHFQILKEHRNIHVQQHPQIQYAIATSETEITTTIDAVIGSSIKRHSFPMKEFQTIADNQFPTVINNLDNNTVLDNMVRQLFIRYANAVLLIPIHVQRQSIDLIAICNKIDQTIFLNSELQNAHIMGKYLAAKLEQGARLAQRTVTRLTIPHDIVEGSVLNVAYIDMARYFKDSLRTMIIIGEGGTGKRHCAMLIHQLSARHNEHISYINCQTIDSNSVTALFAQISAGTCIIDNYFSCTESMRVTIRAHIDTPQTKIKYLFLYRLSLFESPNMQLVHTVSSQIIHIPPLREIKSEIIKFAYGFLKNNADHLQIPSTLKISDAVMHAIIQYPWLGNLDELRQILAHSMNLAENQNGIIKQLKFSFQDSIMNESNMKLAVEKFRKSLIQSVLLANNRNQSKTARQLGIQRTYLNRLLSREHT